MPIPPLRRILKTILCFTKKINEFDNIYIYDILLMNVWHPFPTKTQRSWETMNERFRALRSRKNDETPAFCGRGRLWERRPFYLDKKSILD